MMRFANLLPIPGRAIKELVSAEFISMIVFLKATGLLENVEELLVELEVGALLSVAFPAI